MADAPVSGTLPSFARTLATKPAEERLAILASTHPDYKLNIQTWEVLLDAFEGRGGFLNGGYLWPYAREEQTGFTERQKWARYHNYLEALVDLYVRFVFTQGVKRSSKSEEYNAWTDNVDGAGTGMTQFLKQLVSMALVCGHAGVLLDKTEDEPAGPTKAEEVSRCFASIFAASSIADWRYDENRIAAVKLLETTPTTDILTPVPTDDSATQYLIWDTDGWARYDAKGELLAAGTPGLDRVPFIAFRPKASQTSRMLGRPLVGNANIVRALFNRASEEDEVLRAQAFSVLTVEIDKDSDIDETKRSLGSVVGTAKALIAKGKIQYATPDQSVPGTIRDNIAYLVQEMYRAAHVKFNRDSLSAQSGESIRLQYTELNEMLQGLAKALAQAEQEIAAAWFAWTEATPEAAQSAFEKAQPIAEYPDEFFLDDLKSDLEAWAEALAMGLGKTMTHRIKKRAVRRIEPEMPEDELKKVDEEIEAMPEEPQPMVAGPLDTGNLAPEMDLTADDEGDENEGEDEDDEDA